MKTLAVCSAKGGATKTTVSAMLAVRAVRDGLNVAIIDLNADQANLSGWWLLRESPMNPRLVDGVENIPAAMKTISSQFDVCILDTPPLDVDVIEQAIAVADAVVIPVRPSILDVSTVLAVVPLAKKHGKPWAFLLSAVDSRDASLRKLTTDAAASLAEIAATHGGRLLGNRIAYRGLHIKAMAQGKVAIEISRDQDVKDELDGVWTECRSLMGVSK